MPTLPPVEEKPSGPERLADAGRRVSQALGADHRVNLRVLVALVVAAIGASLAPQPWAQAALVALLILGIEWARKTR